MHKLFSIVVLVVLLPGGYAQGTKNTTRQNLVWYGYFNTLRFSEKTWLVSELQERHFIAPFAQHQLVMRSHFHYALKEGWETAAGFCIFLQDPNEPGAAGITVPELRPHIEFAQKQKLKQVVFDHRYKVEARFFHNTNADRTALEDGFYWGNFRFRYRFQATINVLKMGNGQELKLRLSDEVHLNAGKHIVLTTFDQNRIYCGLYAGLTDGIAVELGYLNWFQKRPEDADYYNRHIVRLTVFHNINLKPNQDGR